ncbi:esterase-like activity of phytase family protein [Thermodesulfovibrionales bacterium]|nr:esterase-like activity of phytase family protein [Thermodesulfovibrionales bacterium]
MLEGALIGDDDQSRRIIYEFDLKAEEFTGRKFFYRVEDPKYAIGELVAIDENRFLVIERDGKQGEAARLKKLFEIDITRVDAEGYVYKQKVANSRLTTLTVLNFPIRG